jgi:hypothetical protein
MPPVFKTLMVLDAPDTVMLGMFIPAMPPLLPAEAGISIILIGRQATEYRPMPRR